MGQANFALFPAIKHFGVLWNLKTCGILDWILPKMIEILDSRWSGPKMQFSKL